MHSYKSKLIDLTLFTIVNTIDVRTDSLRHFTGLDNRHNPIFTPFHFTLVFSTLASVAADLRGQVISASTHRCLSLPFLHLILHAPPAGPSTVPQRFPPAI